MQQNKVALSEIFVNLFSQQFVKRADGSGILELEKLMYMTENANYRYSLLHSKLHSILSK